jgi:superfamily I DNA and RNA helicase
VVLTGRGRAKSKLLNADQIGKFSTRHFTGQYTHDGNPIWTEGDLLTETIFRFKGQSAPAVVLSEIDFIEMNNIERNKLFVGFTRAQMAIEIILSESAESWFTGQLS